MSSNSGTDGSTSAQDYAGSGAGRVLTSGPAATDRNYWIFVTLLCIGMTGWFAYDGAIGYLNKNRVEAKRQLGPILHGAPLPELTDRPTDADFLEMIRSLIKARGATPHGSEDPVRLMAALRDTGRIVSAEEVRKHEHFTKPVHKKEDAGATVEYHASLYGMAILQFRNGAFDLQASGWRSWGNTPEKVRAQFYWALVPFAFGLYAGLRLFRAATLQVTIDDRGMTHAGRLIPWDAMVSLRDYSPKGWVDLYHTASGGPEKRLRIDNQRVKLFDEIVEAICAKKGWENPVKAFAAAKAEEAA